MIFHQKNMVILERVLQAPLPGAPSPPTSPRFESFFLGPRVLNLDHLKPRSFNGFAHFETAPSWSPNPSPLGPFSQMNTNAFLHAGSSQSAEAIFLTYIKSITYEEGSSNPFRMSFFRGYRAPEIFSQFLRVLWRTAAPVCAKLSQEIAIA